MTDSIWGTKLPDLEQINRVNKSTMMETLEITYTEIGADYLMGEMPITHKTVQPLQKLHGGASCVLAETLGSVASNIMINRNQQMAVGQSITTQHLRPGNKGDKAIGKASLIHKGSKSHLWNIDIKNSEGKLLSTTRLSMAIIDKN